ncbi:hypothetical protein G7Y89_g11657 [Cudoniella acicularis]|uniref:Heterokaryon incompatibility domain-containing protein n=1 Tax=Cudoniella acicularis TaxID=354080 RepID=A0A8H4VXT7_9HELO|nr:hypothetical protein G7Y89_g11657 [Cudoniella acicularis]
MQFFIVATMFIAAVSAVATPVTDSSAVSPSDVPYDFAPIAQAISDANDEAIAEQANEASASVIEKRTCGTLKGTALTICQKACEAACDAGTGGLARTLCKKACTLGVNQMGTIYKQAVQVIAWLGRPRVGEGPSILESVGAFPSLERLNDQLKPGEEWLDLVAICELPYWHRLWIVQEVGLADKLELYHGSIHNYWEPFSRILMNFVQMNQEDVHLSIDRMAKLILETPSWLAVQREKRNPSLLYTQTAIRAFLPALETTGGALEEIWKVVHLWNMAPDFRGEIPPPPGKGSAVKDTLES